MVEIDCSDITPNEKKKEGMMGGKPKDMNDNASHKIQRIKRL